MGEYRQRFAGWEQEQRERYELARWTVWHSYNLSPYLKPGYRPKAPKDVYPFPWDKGAKKKKITRKDARITEQEKAALDAIMKDFYQRKYSS